MNEKKSEKRWQDFKNKKRTQPKLCYKQDILVHETTSLLSYDDSVSLSVVCVSRLDLFCCVSGYPPERIACWDQTAGVFPG